MEGMEIAEQARNQRVRTLRLEKNLIARRFEPIYIHSILGPGSLYENAMLTWEDMRRVITGEGHNKYHMPSGEALEFQNSECHRLITDAIFEITQEIVSLIDKTRSKADRSIPSTEGGLNSWGLRRKLYSINIAENEPYRAKAISIIITLFCRLACRTVMQKNGMYENYDLLQRVRVQNTLAAAINLLKDSIEK